MTPNERTRSTRRRVLKVIGAGAVASPLAGAPAAAKGGNLKRELAQVRSATAKYNNVDHATDDGFELVSDFICNMGYHYLDFNRLFDDSLRIAEPTALYYGQINGNLVLGGVEYLIPTEMHPSKPDLFNDEDAHLHVSEEHGWRTELLPFGEVWSLHAWVHTHNPNGVFDHTNPRHMFTTDQDGECTPGGGH